MKKTLRMELAEFRFGKPIKELLRDWFAAGMTHSDIATKLGISLVTFYQWLDWLEARLERQQSTRVSFASDESAETVSAP